MCVNPFQEELEWRLLEIEGRLLKKELLFSEPPSGNAKVLFKDRSVCGGYHNQKQTIRRVLFKQGDVGSALLLRCMENAKGHSFFHGSSPFNGNQRTQHPHREEVGKAEILRDQRGGITKSPHGLCKVAAMKPIKTSNLNGPYFFLVLASRFVEGDAGPPPVYTANRSFRQLNPQLHKGIVTF